MKLSIIIVSWNVKDDLLNCLRSIGGNLPGFEFEVIVVDNASGDGTIEAVKENFPNVKLIANSINRGFAAGNNQGEQIANGQYILLLNPDTKVHKESLDTLIRFMDTNGDVGICGPKLLNIDGSTQSSARRYPTFRGALYRHTVFRYLGLFRYQYKKWLMKDFGYDVQMDVDQVMGAALMMRRDADDKTKLLDENFFMYYEEVDLCYRIKKGGRQIVFVPDSVITHIGGRSAGQIPAEKQFMMLRSLLYFFRKHRGRFTTGLFNIIFKPAVILRHFFELINGLLSSLIALVLPDKEKGKKAREKIKKNCELLRKYSFKILFEI